MVARAGLSGGATVRGRGRSLALIDQVVYAASNLLGSVVAAAVLSLDGFGVFAIGLAISLSLSGLVRASVADELLATSLTEISQENAWTIVVGRLAVGGPPVLLLAALSTALTTGEWPMVICVMAATYGIGVHDILRVLAYRSHRKLASIVSNITWLLVQGVVTLLLLLHGTRAPAAYLAAWALPSLAACWVLFDHPRVWPRNVHLSARFTGLRYGLAFLLRNSSIQLAIVIMGVVGTAEMAGGMKGVQILFGVSALAYTALSRQALPHMTELVRQGNSRYARQHAALAGVLIAVTVVATILLIWLIPAEFFEAILGDTSEVALSLVIPFGIFRFLEALEEPFLLWLRSIRAEGRLLMATAAIGSCTVLGAAWSAGTGSVALVAWTLAAGAFLALTIVASLAVKAPPPVGRLS